MRFRFEFLILGVAALFFIPFLGQVHLFDWDEINFAEAAREMLETQQYGRVYINYVPFWEKPPLFLWFQALSMQVFGVNEMAARLPNAVAGMLTLLVLFRIGKKLYNTQFGLIWVGTYIGSILPHFYFKTGIIDPFFNLFIFLGIYFLVLFYWKKENFQPIHLSQKPFLYLFLSGLFIGLGVLTKGPVAYLLFGLVLGVYFIYKRFEFFIQIKHFLLLTLVVLVVSSAWFALEVMENGLWFLVEFVKYQYRLFSTPDAGHGGFVGYHVVVLFFGCFPASIFAIDAFFSKKQSFEYQEVFKIFMQILFWVVLILFSIVKSKIVHYSSLAYFPITFLASLTISQIISLKIPFKPFFKISYLVIAVLISSIILVLPLVGMNIDSVMPLVKDEFAKKNMEAQVLWTNFDLVYGFLTVGIFGTVFYFFEKKNFRTAFASLFLGMAFIVAMVLGFFPRIERYTQGAAIDFFKTLANQDVYVATVGYKSYAHLFYAKIKPAPRNLEKYNGDWAKYILSEDLDKNAYLCVKFTELKKLEGVSRLEKLGEKNGFVFFVRRKLP